MSAARVALGTVELHLPDVDSLKGKRHVIKGLKERVRHKFEVAVAEVDQRLVAPRVAEVIERVREVGVRLQDRHQLSVRGAETLRRSADDLGTLAVSRTSA